MFVLDLNETIFTKPNEIALHSILFYCLGLLHPIIILKLLELLISYSGVVSKLYEKELQQFWPLHSLQKTSFKRKIQV